MMKKGADGSWPLFCASNEPDPCLREILALLSAGGACLSKTKTECRCRDNHEKLAKHVSYGSCMMYRKKLERCDCVDVRNGYFRI